MYVFVCVCVYVFVCVCVCVCVFVSHIVVTECTEFITNKQTDNLKLLRLSYIILTNTFTHIDTDGHTQTLRQTLDHRERETHTHTDNPPERLTLTPNLKNTSHRQTDRVTQKNIQ